MKTLWKICKSILLLALTGIIVWTVLYFSVPKVKDWTNDKVLKIDQSKDDEEKKQLLAENEDLKKQIDSLTSQATTVSTELTTVKTELSEKKTALEKATADKAELETKVGNLSAKVAELENSNSATSAELENKKQELATAQADLQTKTAEVENLTTEKTALENQKTALESQLAEKQNQIQILQAKVAELETQLNPGDDYNYTVEELESLGVTVEYFFSETGNTYIKAGNNIHNFSSQFWLLKNGKLKKLGFEQLNPEIIKIGDRDLIIERTDKTKASYLVDKAGNVKSLNTSNIYSYQYEFYSLDNNTFFVIGGMKICKYDIDTQECLTYDISLNATGSEHTFFFEEANTLYYSIGSKAYFFNFNTQTETQVDVIFSDIIKVENMKYLINGTKNIELLDLETLTFTTLKQDGFSGFNSNLSLKLENGDIILNTTNKMGVFLFNKETEELTTISDDILGLKFIKLNSGKIVATAQQTFASGLGIFVFENNSLSRIYETGTNWDTIVEDENGCTFSSKFDPSLGSVYYDYTTGTCTAVTE